MLGNRGSGKLRVGVTLVNVSPILPFDAENFMNGNGETRSEAFRENPIQDWVDAAVGVGEDLGEGLHHDEDVGVVLPKRHARIIVAAEKEAEILGEPANSERQNDGENHPSGVAFHPGKYDTVELCFGVIE